MQTIYKVEGMTCQGCADNIQNGLNNQSFVTKANVSSKLSDLFLINFNISWIISLDSIPSYIISN